MNSPGQAQHDMVFLFDIDNTLLDNDSILRDLRVYIEQQLGVDGAARYWAIFNAQRDRLGYVDYLGALQAYRLEHIDDPRVFNISIFLLGLAFADHLFADALAVLQHCRTWGPTVIFSDGDAVYQPHKIQRSGIGAVVEGRVLIHVHKELMLENLQTLYPAAHYVMVDDKLSILAAMKKQLGARLTTVFPRQGHYAFDSHMLATQPPADITIERIGDLLRYGKEVLLQAAISV